MEKNQGGKWIVFAYGLPSHANPGEPVTGDAANITANIRIDGGAADAVDDVNPTELEDGYYVFDITAAESNGDLLSIHPVSATANVQVVGVPGALYTQPASFNGLTSAAIADAVWDELQADHTTAGSFGEVATEVADILADTNELQTDDVPGLIAALNDISVADILTTQMTEAYAADGVAPTLTQSLMLIQQALTDFTISGTTWTIRKIDGSSTAATLTLNDGTNPTAATRAT